MLPLVCQHPPSENTSQKTTPGVTEGKKGVCLFHSNSKDNTSRTIFYASESPGKCQNMFWCQAAAQLDIRDRRDQGWLGILGSICILVSYTNKKLTHTKYVK